MDEIKNQIKKFKPNLSESSLKLYIGKLKRFKTKDKFDIKIFNNTDAIFKHLDEYPNISTKKSLLTAIVVALQSQPKQNKKLIEKYQEEMMKYLNQEQSQVFKQEKSDKQKESWLTMDQFVETINKVHKEIKEKKIMKKKELDNCEYQLLQDYIILRLYHEFSWRNDIASIHVIDDEKKIEENKNYLVTRDKEYKIILQQYKTAKRYGKKEYVLDQNLQRLVKKLLKHNTSGFLLLNKNRKSKMSRNNLTLHLNRIFIKHTGKKIGSSMLRHIQSSELNKHRISLEEEKKQIRIVENKFLHSGLMNQLYRKID